MSSDKIALFKQLRPLDVNVCAALSDKPRAMTLLTYEGDGLTDRLGDSPFTKSLLDEEPISATQVNATTLDWAIEHSGWKIDRIGYLNIDCEGHDLNVLKGFSLDKYRPSIVTIEASLDHERAETVPYLAGFGYSHKETLRRTLLFVREQ
jgi:FkbM family methyltransferase